MEVEWFLKLLMRYERKRGETIAAFSLQVLRLPRLGIKVFL